MEKIEFTEHAVLMCRLAEYQDGLDEAVELATVEYLRAQRYASERLDTLRKAIDLRDAMQTSRKYIGSSQ